MTTNFFTHARLAHGYWRAHEWGLDDQGFLRMIHQALALGIRVFDHAGLAALPGPHQQQSTQAWQTESRS